MKIEKWGYNQEKGESELELTFTVEAEGMVKAEGSKARVDRWEDDPQIHDRETGKDYGPEDGEEYLKALLNRKGMLFWYQESKDE